MTRETDLMLQALLAVPERAPDEAFARRVERLVQSEVRLRAARRAAWRNFAVELAAAATSIGAFLLIERLAPDSGDVVPLFGPAAAGLLLLLLFVLVFGRPESAAPNH